MLQKHAPFAPFSASCKAWRFLLFSYDADSFVSGWYQAWLSCSESTLTGRSGISLSFWKPLGSFLFLLFYFRLFELLTVVTTKRVQKSSPTESSTKSMWMEMVRFLSLSSNSDGLCPQKDIHAFLSWLTFTYLHFIFVCYMNSYPVMHSPLILLRHFSPCIIHNQYDRICSLY